MRHEEQDEAVLQRLLNHVDEFPVPTERANRPAETYRKPTQIWQLPGLAGHTRLSTDFGEVPVHLIRMRDKVRCVDGRYLRVLRIQEFKLDQEFVDLHPQAKPVVIRKNALGQQLPLTEIELSPAQRLILPSDWAKRKPVRADTLSPTRSSCDLSSGIVSYYSFDVGEATLLQGEGVWFASYTG
ncbi:MAG: Hint domain-containing protein [Pseudomonadota bacterium]